jgi:tetratricopeptide (TPR) repeat protein
MSTRTFFSALNLSALAAVLLVPQASFAAMDPPPARPKIDCSDQANKGKPACAPQHGQLSDDQVYESAYWSAKNGDYKAALAIVAQAQNKDDPRILRVTGFATRKLGDVDAGMAFYQKALAINPADTRTRQYMGEAFITKGDLASARVQLGEIEKHCGNAACEDYKKLSDAIAAVKS